MIGLLATQLSDLNTTLALATILVIFIAVLGIRLHLRWGRIEATVNDVNKAVNHRPQGDPPLVQRVENIEREVQNVKKALAKMTKSLNLLTQRSLDSSTDQEKREQRRQPPRQ